MEAAAAQAVISAVINPLVKKAYQAAGARLQSEQESNLEEELEDLAKRLSDLKGYLQDAEHKQSKDASIRHWLSKLEDVLYDAEDLLDDYAADVSFKTTGKYPTTTKVSHLLCCFPVRNKNMDEYKKRLNNIITRFHGIMTERKDLGLQIFNEPAGFPVVSSFQRPQTISSTDDEVFTDGRSKIKRSIVDKLLGLDGVDEFISNDKYPCIVLPIIGMGGIGKTTLAKSVYNDELIQDHFHVRIWVCVSNEFNVDNLRKEIMQAGLQYGDNKEICDTSNLNSLYTKFREYMKDKKYFLVLDDAWNEDKALWESLLNSINVGMGSRIMVTTRKIKVAGAINNRMNPITLEGLSMDDTWKVLQKYAFRNFNSNNSALYHEFKLIGREILSKLKGSPLAAKSIGSLLSSNMELKYWRDILRNNLWADVKDDIFPILLISYQNLRPVLKRCFAYCSLFPEDYKFNEQDLVDLWIAEGCVQDESDTTPEDLGRGYFIELKERSFFQPSFSIYVMHDLLHELSRLVSSETYTWMHDTRPRKLQQSTTVRRMSFHGNNIQTSTLMDACKFEKLRTLLIPNSYEWGSSIATIITEDVLESWFTRLKYLRVLKLRKCGIRKLPDSIENLKLLRYLDLSFNQLIEQMPTSIGLCYKLEVLNLKGCRNLNKLPESLLGLVRMKCLKADRHITSSLGGIGKLVLLQELEYFVVSKEDGHMINELNPLNQLHGALEISGLENVDTKAEARNADLNKKEYLEKLELRWNNCEDTLEYGREEDVLEGLKPHDYLKVLTIVDNHGSRIPTWMNRKDMPCLERINFQGCSKWEVLPPLGAFVMLREIILCKLKSLKRIDHQFYGSGVAAPFPCLEKLVLRDNASLEEWEKVDSEEHCCFPKLSHLDISNCPNFRSMPSLPSNIDDVCTARVGLASLNIKRSCTDGGTKENSISSNVSSPCMINKVSSNVVYLYINECPKLTSIGKGMLGKALESVEIHNCPELVVEYSQELLSSLRELKITKCPKLDTSSILGRSVSSSLKTLEIGDIDGIDSLLSTSCLGSLNKLEKLSFSRCSCLSSYSEIQDGIQLHTLTSLTKLHLQSCPTLFPHLFPCARTTAGVDIGDKQLLKLSGVCIEDADIDDKMLHTLLLQQLLPSALVDLRIEDCNNIKSLPDDVLGRLSSLFYLRIKRCAQLEYIGRFHSLYRLSIGSCPNLTLAANAAASPTVTISDLYARNCSVQLLTQLLMQYSVTSDLVVKNMHGLACFDGELEEALLRQKLLGFYLIDCPKMERLPNNLRGITTLKELIIRECPELRKRYSVNDGGPDWKDVSHIPHVYFD